MTDDTMEQMLPEAAGTLDPKLKAEQAAQPSEDDRERYRKFKQRIDACKQYRRKLVANWTSNIDYRRGKPFASQTDEDRVVVNLDWSLTKAKQAALFSQVPQVRVNHPPQTLDAGPWVHTFEQRLNDTLVTAGIESAMDEVLPDVINAAGVGAIHVSHEMILEDRDIPEQDLSMFAPEQQQQILQTKMLPNGMPLTMKSVPFPVDRRYLVTRISPADLLWPINFTGADFDDAPWKGFSGRTSWASAKRMFKLDERDKINVLGGDQRSQLDKLTHDIEKDKDSIETEVSYDQIFYKEYHYDSNVKSYYTIRRMVFVAGKDDPVIDEPWQGQKVLADGSVIGAIKCPLRFLTLTYITDETIPPSDSAIGRPQVNEINKGRTQMINQRERSLPVRWFNVDRVDPTIQQNLMRGTWQGMIPVQGDGSRVIGEVARAPMGQENFNFDGIAKNDLNESWQIGPNQQGNFGEGRQSAKEAGLVESNFQTRIGRERAKVAKFFVSIAEVLGGLMCIFEDPASFGQGFDPSISKVLSYSILADSTVLIDSQQRIQRLMDFINMTAKSGWVDVGPVIKEIATLSGLDPNVVVKPPQPAPPEAPTISLRLTGVEDLLNPMALAFMMQSGQAPTPQLVEQAKKLIGLSVIPPLPPEPGPGGPGGPPVGPMGPGTDAVMPPQAPPVGVGEAMPDFTLMPKVNKRSDDGRM